MVLWLTNQGPFVSPLPTDLKLHVQVQEATTRTEKKKKLGRVKITRGDRGWGRQRTRETLFQFRPQNPNQETKIAASRILVIFLDDYAKIKVTKKHSRYQL